MLVCTNANCREYVGYPSATTYYGNAILDCNEGIDELSDIMCSDCDSHAEYCEYCLSDTYCEEHRVDSEEGELFVSSFSSDIKWVAEKPKVA